MRFVSKRPNSQCVTFRTTDNVFTLLMDESEKTHKSISATINAKIHNAFNILFSEAKNNGR